MSEKEFDPTQSSVPVNAARLYRHIIAKGLQAGGVVGCGAVVPALAILEYRRSGSLEGQLPRFAAAVGRTAIVVTALGATMGAARMYSYENLKDALEDRAYRLHYNKSQNRVDLFANIGAAAGGLAAATLVGPGALVLLGGVAAGSAAGVVAHIATTSNK